MLKNEKSNAHYEIQDRRLHAARQLPSWLTFDVGQNMKRCLLIAIVALMLVCGCRPVLIRYKHVVVAESAKLKVTERSAESNDSQGKPLSKPRIGLPTKSILTGNGYVVTVYTPVNSLPVVFLKASDERQKVLALRGAHLRQLEKRSGLGIEGYSHSFIVDEANGAPMEFDVLAEQGTVLSHEKIVYDVISRGYVWAIDAL